MGTPFDSNVATRRPPHLAGGTDATKTKNFTTAGASSTTEQDLLGDDNIRSYVVMQFNQAGASAGAIIGYIAFGPTLMNAATTSDWAVHQGDVWEWLALGSADRFFRLIRSGAVDTTVQAYLSDQGA